MDNPNEIGLSELAKLLCCSVSNIHYHVAQGKSAKGGEGRRKTRAEIFFDKKEIAKKFGLDDLPEEFLTVKDAAKEMNCSPETIKNLCKHPHLPLPHYGISIKHGYRLLFLRKDLEKYLEEEHALFVINDCNSVYGGGDVRLNFILEVFELSIDNGDLGEKTKALLKNYFLAGKSRDKLSEELAITKEGLRIRLEESKKKLREQIVSSGRESDFLRSVICERDLLRETLDRLRGRWREFNAELEGIEEPEKPAPIPIADLDLSVRARRCLRVLKIQYLHELENYSQMDLLKLQNSGRKTADEIAVYMEKYGLRLKKK